MAGHRGRQARIPAGGRRPIRHTVKVLPEQEARLQREAAQEGVSVSRLLVERALAGDGWTTSEKRALKRELLSAANQVVRVGTNANQLAAWAHREQRYPGAADEAFAVIEATVSELRAAAEAVQRP